VVQVAEALELRRTLGGQIELANRFNQGQIDGLDTTVRVPPALAAAHLQANR
jgi:hypothetical protein